MKHNGVAFCHASAELRGDREFILAAVKQNVWALNRVDHMAAVKAAEGHATTCTMCANSQIHHAATPHIYTPLQTVIGTSKAMYATGDDSPYCSRPDGRKEEGGQGLYETTKYLE